MAISINKYLSYHGSALQMRSKRANVIASNIANASTPNYKARDFDVSNALKKISQLGPLKTSSDRHFVSDKSAGSSKVQFRLPTMSALDGNTVEMSVEQTSFAENTTKYQATATFLTGRIQTLRSAIKGE
mgnify:CR=1 FL=1